MKNEMVLKMEMKWRYLAAESMPKISLMRAMKTYVLLSKSLTARIESGLSYEPVVIIRVSYN